MRISIITHYYPPEIGAPQARLSEMAKTWVKEGCDVNVITCFPNHPTGIIPEEYRNRSYMEENIDGVKVHRCRVYATPNKGFIKKLLGHISFMFTSVLQGRKAVKESDIILVSSPTFFSVMSAWLLSKLYRKPYIFEVRDLWPAIFVELGVLKNKLIIRILEMIEMFLYRQSAAVVTVTKSFAENIVQRGIKKEKLQVITNGVNLDLFSPSVKDVDLLKEHNLENKFIVLYIGAHGISHSLSKIIEVASQLKEIDGLHFLFVGEGAQKDMIVKQAKELSLGNVTFLPGQPKEMVPKFYSIMDLAMVPLRSIPLFDTFIPSKMFEIMGMAKPILGSVRGEAAEILSSSGAAKVCEPEDVESIAKTIRDLYEEPAQLRSMGENGRKFVEENYDRSVLAVKYLTIINNILNKG